jgi:hypothetical protein
LNQADQALKALKALKALTTQHARQARHRRRLTPRSGPTPPFDCPVRRSPESPSRDDPLLGSGEPDGDMRLSRRVATLIVGGVAVLVVSVSACEQKQVDEPVSARTYQLAVSRSSDRSSSVPLTGRLLGGRFYVFVSPDT